MSNVICQTNKEIPADMVLGNLLFMNLTDMTIPVNKLENIFKAYNIPQSFIRKIVPADAFRRATSKVKGKTLDLMYNGQLCTVKIEVDEVRCDTDSIKRIIGAKRIDQANENIEYDPVAEVIFTRTGSTLSKAVLFAPGDYNYSVVEQVTDEVTNMYNDWILYHNKDTVKNIVNRIVSSTHPVNLMPTGLCKFIPQTSTDLIYNLKGALQEMSSCSIQPNSENIVEIIPVLDTTEQRGLIEKNFRAEITDELFGFTQELKEVLNAKKKIGTRMANAYVTKFNTLRDKAKEYESLLGVYVGAIYSQLKDAMDLISTEAEDDSEV